MPKRVKKKETSRRNAGRVTGPVSTWTVEERLGYHLAEAAMHLQTITQILDENEERIPEKYIGVLREHRRQAGLRLQVFWRICEKVFPNMLKQPR